MTNVKFFLRGHARSDISQIRRYTIKTWRNEQWESYKKFLFNKLQRLANNPEMGISVNEISLNAFRFPLKDHVIYYLRRDKDVVFVGILSASLSPAKHLLRALDLKDNH